MKKPAVTSPPAQKTELSPHYRRPADAPGAQSSCNFEAADREGPEGCPHLSPPEQAPAARSAVPATEDGRDGASFRPSEALRFLALLGKDPAKARFRFFPHKGNPENEQIGARKLVGLDAQRITRYQQEGRGAYVTIGHSDGRGDKKRNILTVPALFVEWDDKPIAWQLEAWRELGLPEPSIQVATGGASIHTYWVLTSPMASSQWEPLQQRLIRLCGSDKECKDTARVMRLPGCAYIGPDGTPIGQTTIISATGKQYDAEEILAALPAEAPDPAPAPITQALAPSAASRYQGKIPPRSVEEVAAAAKFIPTRVRGGGTYGTDRNALCGCAAALAEAGHPNPEEHALTLLGDSWPTEREARQVLESTSTRKAASFWAIAGEHGFELRRRPPSTQAHERVGGQEQESDFCSFDGLSFFDGTDGCFPEREDALQSNIGLGQAPMAGGAPFRVLGWRNGLDAVWVQLAGGLPGAVPLTKAGMQRLAPIEYWNATFPGPRQGSPPAWDQAISSVRDQAETLGAFELDRVRGCGVWLDQDRVVWHQGGRLEVDGQPMALAEIKSAYIYASRPVLDLNPDVAPLTDAEGSEILNLFHLDMKWGKVGDGLLVAGHTVLGNVCAALEIRPGMQLTGPSGEGKSTTENKLINPLQANLAKRTSGATEAGVRQDMGHDALPAVIDESEQENPKRREGHLNLLRLCFDGLKQLKGTPGGQAHSYTMRSMMTLIGINAEISNPADRNRLIVIRPRKLDKETWSAVQIKRDQLITLENGQRLIRRTVSNLKALLANIQTFTAVVATQPGTDRTHQVMGSLLAGAHHLTCTEVVDADAAKAWLEAVGWRGLDEETLEATSAHAEAQQCLDHLLGACCA
jgi:hypothetical protein